MAKERAPLNKAVYGNSTRTLSVLPLTPRNFRRPFGNQAIARDEFFEAAAGGGEVTGTANAMLIALTAAFSGDRGATGTSSAVLPNLTTAFTGEEVFAGAIAANLSGLVADFALNHGVTGTADAVLPILGAEFAGEVETTVPADAAIGGGGFGHGRSRYIYRRKKDEIPEWEREPERPQAPERAKQPVAVAPEIRETGLRFAPLVEDTPPESEPHQSSTAVSTEELAQVLSAVVLPKVQAIAQAQPEDEDELFLLLLAA